MNRSFKVSSLILFISLFFCTIDAQENSSALPSFRDAQLIENEECIRRYSPLVIVNFLVLNDNNEFIMNLTSKDFEVYEEDKLKAIEFFKFDELENHYKLGFLQEDLIDADKNREVKVELKKEIKKNYENVFVKEMSRDYLDQD